MAGITISKQDTPNHYRSFIISNHNFAKIVKDDLTLSK